MTTSYFNNTLLGFHHDKFPITVINNPLSAYHVVAHADCKDLHVSHHHESSSDGFLAIVGLTIVPSATLAYHYLAEKAPEAAIEFVNNPATHEAAFDLSKMAFCGAASSVNMPCPFC